MGRIVGCLAIALCLAGCSGACTPGTASSSVSDIQNDLNHNPVFHDKGYTVSVQSFDHGYLTLAVKGLRQESATMLKQGETLGDIVMHGEWNARALTEADETLHKRPDVKGVKWVPAP